MTFRYLYRIVILFIFFIAKAKLGISQCDVTITQQPSLPSVVCLGTGSQALSVAATVKSGGTLTYQWYFNNIPIANGGSDSTYIISNLTQASNGEYKVQVRGECDLNEKQDVNSSTVVLTLGNTPLINNTLVDQTICEGAAFSTSVNTNTRNGGPVSYSWVKLNTNAVLSTNAVLNMNNIASSDAGRYRITVTNSCGVGASDTMLLNTITKPVSNALNGVTTISSCENESIILQTETNSNGNPAIFEWYKVINGTPVLLPNDKSSSYTINSFQPSNAGIYRFVSSNVCGVATNPVNFTVNPPRSKPSIIVQPQSSNVNCADYTLRLSVTGSSNAGDITYKWTKGAAALESNSTITYSNDFNSSTLVITDPEPTNNGNYTVSLTNTCGTTQSVSVSVFVNVIKPQIISLATLNQVVCESQSVLESPTVKYQNDFSFTYAWYKSGSVNSISSTRELFIPSFADINEGDYKLRVTNTCGTYIESAPIKFSIAKRPLITTQPSLGSQIACLNKSIVLTSVASSQNGGPITYRWLRDNILVSEKQSAELSLLNMQSSQQGSYRVDIENKCGVTTSNSVQVALGTIPTLESKTPDSTYCYGSNIVLGLIANSNNGGILSYNWSSSAEGNLVNTGASYTINSLSQNKTGTYSVAVSNACGTMAQPVVMLVRGLDKPIITQFVSNDNSFCTGNSLNLSVSASSASEMVYNWYQGSTIVKANSSDDYYQKGNLGLSDAGSYSVRITNACGTQSSAAINISVKGKPTIVTDISRTIDCSGAKSLQLAVAGADNGGGTIFYQWFKNGNPLGSNTSSLTINNITSATSGTYYVSLSNTCGAVNSASSIVHINFDVPTIELQPKSGSFCQGQPLLLEVVAKDENRNNFSYQWTKDGINLIGQTRSILSKDALLLSDAGQYRVTVTGLCGVTNSTDLANIVIKAAPTPTFTINTTTTQCLNSNIFEFTDNSSASSSFIREWVFDDGSTSIVGPSVRHTYKTTGIHNVLLKHTATNGCTGTYSQNITVSSTPIITQQLKNSIACLGGDISLDILVNENFGGNLVYTWRKNGVIVSSANTSSGSYEIYGVANADRAAYSVSVSNTCGTVNSDTVQLSISEKPFLSNFIAEKNICNDFVDTVFVSMKSLLPITKYTWYRNEGFYSNTISPYLSFSNFRDENKGTYFVEAENACGITRSNDFALNLKQLPLPLFSVSNDTVCYKSSKLIDAVFNNNIKDTLTYQWYQDDEILQTESKSFIFPVFSNSGVYEYKVQATNSCGSTTVPVRRIFVNKIAPQFIVDSTGGCDNNLSVSIQNRTAKFYFPLVTWNALYDDGLQDQIAAPANFVFHKYNKSGDFNLKLYATDSVGCSSDTVRFKVTNYAPSIANFIVRDTCLGSNTIFTNLAKKGAGSLGFDFIKWETEGQVVEDTSETINFQYQRSGIYNVAMYVRGKNSCITSKIEKQVVIIGAPEFTIDSVGGCKNELKVSVVNSANNPHIRNFLWDIDYGDGTKRTNLDSASILDTYRYSRPGSYIVKINTSGLLACQNKSITKTVVNYGLSKASFTVNDTCAGLPNTFTNTSIKGFGNTSFGSVKWRMGDTWLEDSSAKFPYSFPISGKYTVALYVQGNNNCITDSITKEVNVIGNPEFIFDSSGSCSGELTVTVKNINVNQNIKNFFWEVDYGNGFGKKRLDSLVKTDTYTYTNPGRYQVKVRSNGNLSCQTVGVDKAFTNFGAAKANFTVGDTCYGLPSLFKNTSFKGFGNTGYAFAKWYINDNIIYDTSASIKFTYPKSGVFNASLVVQGDSSCVVDSISKQFVIIDYPVANFEYKDSCAGFDVFYTDKSIASLTDAIGQWQWNFSDKGLPSFNKNPIRSFQKEGSYAVTLLVQSKYCPQFYDDTTINVTIVRPRPNLRYNTLYTVKDFPNKMNSYPNGRSYEWIPNFYLNNARIQQPIINPGFIEKEYQVRIIDSAGCINVDTLMVWGYDKPDIYLPTAFSPNNDGFNDVYKAEYVMIDRLEYFTILDKFNNVIFQTKNMSETWDGMYQGKIMPTDVYFVVISAVDKRNNRIQKKVKLNLLR